VLPPETRAALERLCEAEGVALRVALLAGVQIWLHRCTAQEVFSVGLAVAAAEGDRWDAVPLRADLADDPTGRALLARVRDAVAAAEALRRAGFPAPGAADAPPFDALLVPPQTRAQRLPEGLALQVSLEEAAGTLAGSITAADRFDAATVARLADVLTLVLAGLAARPGDSVSRLPILTEAERARIAGWNDTRFAHPTDRLLHEIFAAQAAATPAAVALTFEGRDVTYRELDEQSNRVAHALQRRGLGPDALVGVLAERSVEMLAALYGVLKAGAAYVPLDPDYPPARLGFMLEDARPRVILAQARHVGLLPAHDAEVLPLDPALEAFAAEPATPPARGALGLDHLAYVIFTSGSTGRPKGAMNTHRGVLNRLLWGQHHYGMTPADRVMQKTPFSFDVSVWELYWPLMFGARLVVARPGGHREPAYLSGLIAAQGITTMHFVPSMLSAFVEDRDVGRCASLARVFCSGEALLPALVDRFAERLPGVRLHNLYGPTEAAVEVTYTECHPGAAVVPIGKPVHNTRMHILGPHLLPVPEGVRGELYIGGVQVGRGYLNRPGLTAERFLADPFDATPGARLYKTGDVARWLPDGAIEYLGRADFQVKVRGFRIELGEIEAALADHPGVRDAVVLAREDRPGDVRLVAYWTAADPAAAPPVADLRAHLGGRLPEHMVPAILVQLPALPLLSSGKIDRRALPAPKLGSGEYVAPSTPTEEAIAAIWAEVLGLPRVSVRDEFFALGGHSLLAAKVLDAVDRRFGKSLPLVTLLLAPTVERLAALVLAEGPGVTVTAGQSPSVIALRREGTKRPLFLARPGSRSSGALMYAALAQKIDPDRPVYAFLNRPAVDLDAPYASIEDMAAEYLAAMRAIQPRGPYLLGGWSLAGMTAFEMANRLVARGERVERLVFFEVDAPCSLRGRASYHADYALRRARLRACAQFPWLPRLVPSIRVAGARSAIARFGGLAYYDPDNDDVALIGYAFPGQFDLAALRAMVPEQRWRHVYAALRAAEPGGVQDEGADGVRVRQGYRYFLADGFMGARYAPRWVYPGETTIFVGRQRSRWVDPWRPYLTREPEVHAFEFTGTPAVPSAHDALMAEVNVARMADTLNRVLGPA
jgi:amino acid adenylation domain-containing protein